MAVVKLAPPVNSQAKEAKEASKRHNRKTKRFFLLS